MALARPVASCDREAGAVTPRAPAAAELNVRLPLTMVTRAAGPWAAGPLPRRTPR